MVSSIVAISGPSGSGKTLLATTLRAQLQSQRPINSVTVLAEDAYYHDQSHLEPDARARVNFDHPAALDHGLLLEHLRQLRQGNSVQVPVYDYQAHVRSERSYRQAPADVVLVEGILLLSNPQLRLEFDFSLFIETPLDLCLTRRIARDTRERGRSEESVQRQFRDSVEPMYHQHIAPSAAHAHLVVRGSDDHEHNARLLGSHILARLNPNSQGGEEI